MTLPLLSRRRATTTASRCVTCLRGQRLLRNSAIRFTLERAQRCARALGRCLSMRSVLTCAIRTRGARACARWRLISSRWF